MSMSPCPLHPPPHELDEGVSRFTSMSAVLVEMKMVAGVTRDFKCEVVKRLFDSAMRKKSLSLRKLE